MARRAGVSPKTVSNVVNERPVVRPETRERVLEAIKELDYRPSALARGLVTRSRRLIGLLLSDITNPAYPEMVEAVASVARQNGFTLLLCNTARDPAEEGRYVDLLIEQQVDGAIIATCRLDSQAADLLAQRGIQVVLFNRRPAKHTVSFIGVDNVGGAYAATQHLIELGHRQIAFVRGAELASTSQEREEGYLRALRANKIELNPRLILSGDYRAEVARQAVTELLSGPDRPTAIFAANDVMALGVIDAALGLGLRVPEDLAVVGFDDITVASNRLISLTTVNGDLPELAREATELLIQLITDPSHPAHRTPIHKILPVSLQIRRTSGGPLRTQARVEAKPSQPLST